MLKKIHPHHHLHDSSLRLQLFFYWLIFKFWTKKPVSGVPPRIFVLSQSRHFQPFGLATLANSLQKILQRRNFNEKAAVKWCINQNWLTDTLDLKTFITILLAKYIFSKLKYSYNKFLWLVRLSRTSLKNHRGKMFLHSSKCIRPKQIRRILKPSFIAVKKMWASVYYSYSRTFETNGTWKIRIYRSVFPKLTLKKLPFQLRKSLFRALISEDHRYEDMLSTQEMSFRKLGWIRGSSVV